MVSLGEELVTINLELFEELKKIQERVDIIPLQKVAKLYSKTKDLFDNSRDEELTDRNKERVAEIFFKVVEINGEFILR